MSPICHFLTPAASPSPLPLPHPCTAELTSDFEPPNQVYAMGKATSGLVGSGLHANPNSTAAKAALRSASVYWGLDHAEAAASVQDERVREAVRVVGTVASQQGEEKGGGGWVAYTPGPVSLPLTC